MEDSHNAIQGGMGGRLWAVRRRATRLSWVRPEICWLWLEQSIPYHGAWCSGKVLKKKLWACFYCQFKCPVSLTCHISLFQRSMILLCYQMPSWSTCPTRPALTSQSFAPVQVTATAWRLWKTSSTKTFLESMVLLLSSTSQHRGTSETCLKCTSAHRRLAWSSRLRLNSQHAALLHVTVSRGTKLACWNQSFNSSFW